MLLIFVDLLMVVLHLLFGDKTIFNLDMESNLPTIYQGSKSIFTANVIFLILALIFLKKGNLKREWIWIFLGVGMFFLGVDEIGQVHENISKYAKEIFGGGATEYEATVADLGYTSTNWLPYYILLFVPATVFIVMSLKKFYKENRRSVWFLIFGWLFFIGVLIVEFINTMSNIMFQDGYWTLMIFEESFEMIGASLLLTFALVSLQEKVSFLNIRE